MEKFKYYFNNSKIVCNACSKFTNINDCIIVNEPANIMTFINNLNLNIL